MNDPWYEELKRIGRKYGFTDYEVTSMKNHYNRRLRPLDAFIAAMEDAGLSNEFGEFGAWEEEENMGL